MGTKKSADPSGRVGAGEAGEEGQGGCCVGMSRSGAGGSRRLETCRLGIFISSNKRGEQAGWAHMTEGSLRKYSDSAIGSFHAVYDCYSVCVVGDISVKQLTGELPRNAGIRK